MSHHSSVRFYRLLCKKYGGVNSHKTSGATTFVAALFYSKWIFSSGFEIFW